jgi:hypothetical protein
MDRQHHCPFDLSGNLFAHLDAVVTGEAIMEAGKDPSIGHLLNGIGEAVEGALHARQGLRRNREFRVGTIEGCQDRRPATADARVR